MRRILTGFTVAAILAAIPTLAVAGNQEIADQIVGSLRDSGQMSDYTVGVKYQDGTAWLRGRVSSEEQMATAIKIAFQTRGVSSVVNQLTVGSSGSSPSKTGSEVPRSQAASSSRNPLRGVSVSQVTENSRSPQNAGPAKRLDAFFSPDESSEQSASRADRSSKVTIVRAVSAEEPQGEIPQQMTEPQRAMPMNMSRVAMAQPMVRGPVSPNGGPLPMYSAAAGGGGTAPARYDQPCLPNYAWPSYAAYPNYAAVTYPKQYSPTAWPYIGPFYPYPQVPLGWRKVSLEWQDGWWFLDFKDQPASCWQR